MSSALSKHLQSKPEIWFQIDIETLKIHWKTFSFQNQQEKHCSKLKSFEFLKELSYIFDKPQNHLKVPPEATVEESGKVLRTTPSLNAPWGSWWADSLKAMIQSRLLWNIWFFFKVLEAIQNLNFSDGKNAFTRWAYICNPSQKSYSRLILRLWRFTGKLVHFRTNKKSIAQNWKVSKFWRNCHTFLTSPKIT